MIVLGLDPSLTGFGWAFVDTSKEGKDRCVERGRFATPSKMEEVARFVYMRESLQELISSRNLTKRVACETPFFGGSYSEGMYALFSYVREALKLEKCDVVLLGNQQIKAHAKRFLGRPSNWSMGKPDMIEAVRLDTEGGRWNHNEADAYWVGRMGCAFWRVYDKELQESELSPYERSLFCKVHTYKRGKKAGKTEYQGLIFKKNDKFYLWSEDKPSD